MQPTRSALRPSLLLDFDGTIADSLPLLRRIYFEIVGAFGGSATETDFEALIGVPLRDICAGLVQRYDTSITPEALVKSYLDKIKSEYAGVTAFPDAVRLIEAAGDSGLSIAIVTSSTDLLVRGWLQQQPFRNRISAIVTSDICTRGKPHPEPYLKAMELTHSGPGLAIAVDDAPDGVQAAIASGAQCFALARRRERNEIWPSDARIVTDLDAVWADFTASGGIAALRGDGHERPGLIS